MKLNKPIVLFLFLISFLAFTVASQISQVTGTISVEEVKTCNIVFYDEAESVYANSIYYHNYTSCLNTSGPNTDCSPQQEIITLKNWIGRAAVTKNKTECKPDNKFIITIDKGNAIIKKQIDFSDWGACIHNFENNCLIVTCVSKYDGAYKSQFTDCKGGKSCQKFEICNDSIRTFYKNSRDDFVENDPSFYLPKLTLKEVGK